jgi:hypothetical protein
LGEGRGIGRRMRQISSSVSGVQAITKRTTLMPQFVISAKNRGIWWWNVLIFTLRVRS